jgi:cytochrome P450
MSKHLHYDEVTSNVFLFMILGHDSISTTLAYSTYILATKPQIQTKLQQEIDEISKVEEVDYDCINNINYLDWFIKEVLRMFPIAIQAISRECNQDTVICGYNIHKGQWIILRIMNS